MPDLKENLLKQIRSQLGAADRDVRILLNPPELGEVRIAVSLEDGSPTVSVAASEDLVRHLLAQGLEQLKILFGASRVLVDPVGPRAAEGPGTIGPEAAETVPAALLHETGDGKAPLKADSAPGAHTARGIHLAIGRHQGILDLHRQVLDQIRGRIDASRGEARIRLSPPELGEIRIHLVMEDHRLTARMEVQEPLVRALLERDLGQLKTVLAESGIDVGRFDIHSRGDRSGRRAGEKQPPARIAAAGGTAEEEEATRPERFRAGVVRVNGAAPGVDYLVY